MKVHLGMSIVWSNTSVEGKDVLGISDIHLFGIYVGWTLPSKPSKLAST